MTSNCCLHSEDLDDNGVGAPRKLRLTEEMQLHPDGMGWAGDGRGREVRVRGVQYGGGTEAVRRRLSQVIGLAEEEAQRRELLEGGGNQGAGGEGDQTEGGEGQGSSQKGVDGGEGGNEGEELWEVAGPSRENGRKSSVVKCLGTK